MTRGTRTTAALATSLVLLAACGDGGDDGGEQAAPPVIDVGDGGDYEPGITGADLSGTVTNPWLPLVPGTRWTYEGRTDEGLERIVVEVLHETREVFGVEAVVVRDTVTIDGEVAEDTHDWYAQDAEGNVWYLGEDTAEYEDGEVVDTAGSWEAGVDGALPGIVMPAAPTPGDAYRQEHLPGEAEDMAEVLRTGQRAATPTAVFDDVVTIREWNPFEPDTVEEKHYARGVGLVYEAKVTGDGERIDLVAHEPAR